MTTTAAALQRNWPTAVERLAAAAQHLASVKRPTRVRVTAARPRILLDKTDSGGPRQLATNEPPTT